MILIFCLLASAHAGLLGRCCARALAAVVQDDPYQFELTDPDWLRREIERVLIRQAWGRATAHDLKMLELMAGELAKRQRLEAIK